MEHLRILPQDIFINTEIEVLPDQPSINPLPNARRKGAYDHRRRPITAQTPLRYMSKVVQDSIRLVPVLDRCPFMIARLGYFTSRPKRVSHLGSTKSEGL